MGAGGLGTLLAVLAGYFRGAVDVVISRVTDVFLAVPFLLVAISVVGALGASTKNLILVLVFMTWAGYTRVLRCGYRAGDSAPMAYIELIGRVQTTAAVEPDAKAEKAKPTEKPAKAAKVKKAKAA